MRQARIVGREMWVPDSIAEWDAIAEDSPWEKPRMDSIILTLKPGEVLYDIGAEHGWMSAIFAKHLGPGYTVLVEPSSDFWPNIRNTFEMNDLGLPLASVCAFASDTSTNHSVYAFGWPPEAWGPECGAMAYRNLANHPAVPQITIDRLVDITGQPPAGITMDIEGAELIALRGARRTLAKDRPVVWVSVHPDLCLRDFDYNADEVHNFMAGFGYTRELLNVDHEHHYVYWP